MNDFCLSRLMLQCISQRAAGLCTYEQMKALPSLVSPPSRIRLKSSVKVMTSNPSMVPFQYFLIDSWGNIYPTTSSVLGQASHLNTSVL